MANRSTYVSIGIAIFPVLCLTALRAILPAVDDVLSKDLFSQIISYSFVLIFGLLMLSKYRVIKDHEYHRSKAIRKLSKSYKLEDKGLWENSDEILNKLEIKAKSNFNDDEFNSSMKGFVGSLNKERNEDTTEEEVIESINNNDNNNDNNGNKEPDEISIINQLYFKIKNLLNMLIEKSASKKINNNKASINLSQNNIKWDTKSTNSTSKVTICVSCNSLNDMNSNYCVSCGIYL
ncbi:MAG: hypothetical protein ACI9O1_000534 [Candidatus Thalassarchaeaceae archaeon]|jgi:hypothetical protein